MSLTTADLLKIKAVFKPVGEQISELRKNV